MSEFNRIVKEIEAEGKINPKISEKKLTVIMTIRGTTSKTAQTHSIYLLECLDILKREENDKTSFLIDLKQIDAYAEKSGAKCQLRANGPKEWVEW